MLSLDHQQGTTRDPSPHLPDHRTVCIPHASFEGEAPKQDLNCWNYILVNAINNCSVFFLCSTFQCPCCSASSSTWAFRLSRACSSSTGSWLCSCRQSTSLTTPSCARWSTDSLPRVIYLWFRVKGSNALWITFIRSFNHQFIIDLLFWFDLFTQVPLMRIHLFTVVQLICFAMLWLIKSFKQTSILFPIMVRKLELYCPSSETFFWRTAPVILDFRVSLL